MDTATKYNFVGQTICLSNLLGDYSVEKNTDIGFHTKSATVPTDIAPETTTDCGMYHDTVTGDDCGVVTMKYSISLDDFIFFNPMIWKNCTNLWANISYCVAPMGHISDYPGYGESETSFSINPDTRITTSLPYYDPWAEESDAIIIPLANDTRTDCLPQLQQRRQPPQAPLSHLYPFRMAWCLAALLSTMSSRVTGAGPSPTAMASHLMICMHGTQRSTETGLVYTPTRPFPGTYPEQRQT
jgi:hypothetical protein